MYLYSSFLMLWAFFLYYWRVVKTMETNHHWFGWQMKSLVGRTEQWVYWKSLVEIRNVISNNEPQVLDFGWGGASSFGMGDRKPWQKKKRKPCQVRSIVLSRVLRRTGEPEWSLRPWSLEEQPFLYLSQASFTLMLLFIAVWIATMSMD